MGDVWSFKSTGRVSAWIRFNVADLRVFASKYRFFFAASMPLGLSSLN
jgi:hypothetical protein